MILNAVSLTCAALVFVAYGISIHTDRRWWLDMANATLGLPLTACALLAGAYGHTLLSFGWWVLGIWALRRR